MLQRSNCGKTKDGRQKYRFMKKNGQVSACFTKRQIYWNQIPGVAVAKTSPGSKTMRQMQSKFNRMRKQREKEVSNIRNLKLVKNYFPRSNTMNIWKDLFARFFQYHADKVDVARFILYMARKDRETQINDLAINAIVELETTLDLIFYFYTLTILQSPAGSHILNRPFESMTNRQQSTLIQKFYNYLNDGHTMPNHPRGFFRTLSMLEEVIVLNFQSQAENVETLFKVFKRVFKNLRKRTSQLSI